MSLKRKIVSASSWSVFGSLANNMLRLISNVILVQLLSPGDFGLMAIVMIFILGSSLITDIGISSAVIRHENGTEPWYLNTAWSLQVIQGILIALMLCAIAGPIANYYDQPVLYLLICVAALRPLIHGFRNVALIVAKKKLQQNKLETIHLIAQIGGMIGTISIAYYNPSVWALVIGYIINATVFVLLSYAILPSQNARYQFNKKAFLDIFHYGKWIFVGSLLAFLANQSDRLVLSTLTTVEVLGIFSIAVLWSEILITVIKKISQSVFFPVLANAIHQGGEALAQSLEYRKILLIIVLPLNVLAIASITPFLRLIYPETYSDVGPIAAILMFGGWVRAMYITYVAVNMATGKPKFMAYSSAVGIIIFFLIVFPLFEQFDVLGAAAAVAICQLGMYAVVSQGARIAGAAQFSIDLLYTIIFIITAIAALLASIRMTEYGLPDLATLSILIITASLCFAILVKAVILPFYRQAS